MEPDVDFIAVARAHPDESVNGDAWSVTCGNGSLRIAIIDGLGHGPQAAAAANAGTRVLEERPDLSPVEALVACHEALRHTRGAAAAIAEINGNSISYAGIGNVEARLILPDTSVRFYSRRGIVGASIPRPELNTYDLPERWLLVMHSDGISERFEVPAEILARLDRETLQQLADELLARWARATDDATLLLAWPRHSP